MAKSNMLMGKARGKVGGLVFRVDAGIGQVVSEYNPHPANPRTQKQTIQRSKMNLAGKLSSLTPYDAIAGLDSRKRKARSMFVSNVIKASTGSLTGDMLTNNLTGSLLKLSKGVAYEMTATPTLDTTNNKLKVAVANANSGINMAFIRVVAYFAINTKFEFCVVKDSTTLTGTTSQDVEIPLPQGFRPNVDAVAVYAIPVVTNDGDLLAQYAQAITGGDGFYNTQVSVALSQANAFGDSILAGWIGGEE